MNAIDHAEWLADKLIGNDYVQEAKRLIVSQARENTDLRRQLEEMTALRDSAVQSLRSMEAHYQKIREQLDLVTGALEEIIADKTPWGNLAASMADSARAALAAVRKPAEQLDYERHVAIRELEALNETRLGEIRTTLKLLADARREAAEAQAFSEVMHSAMHRLALEAECFYLDCKDMPILSKWTNPLLDAISNVQKIRWESEKSALTTAIEAAKVEMREAWETRIQLGDSRKHPAESGKDGAA